MRMIVAEEVQRLLLCRNTGTAHEDRRLDVTRLGSIQAYKLKHFEPLYHKLELASYECAACFIDSPGVPASQSLSF